MAAFVVVVAAAVFVVVATSAIVVVVVAAAAAAAAAAVVVVVVVVVDESLETSLVRAEFYYLECGVDVVNVANEDYYLIGYCDYCGHGRLDCHCHCSSFTMSSARVLK